MTAKAFLDVLPASDLLDEGDIVDQAEITIKPATYDHSRHLQRLYEKIIYLRLIAAVAIDDGGTI